MSAAAQDPSDATYCASLVRGSDFERYAATLFVPPEPRRALLALFAFNIEIARIRDQISQPLAGEIRLQWWSDLLTGTAHGEATGNPVAAELMRAIDRHALPQELIGRMIDAHRFDLYDEPMQTMAELEGYLQDTASALFALGGLVLGVEVGDELVRHAGLAFGLTRIVEALPRHASRGQFYLPLDEIGAAGVAPADILAGKSTAELQRYLQGLAEQARRASAAGAGGACARPHAGANRLPAAGAGRSQAAARRLGRVQAVRGAAGGVEPCRAVGPVARLAPRAVQGVARN